MPKRINPQDQWETDFLVPLPGEPRNIGPLEALFQRLLNRTERLKNRLAAILGLPWDATPPDTLAGLAARASNLESLTATACISRGALYSGVDWNTLTTAGVYAVETSAFGAGSANTPPTTYPGGVLLVLAGGPDAQVVVQIYVPHAIEGAIHFRQRYGAWAGWYAAGEVHGVNSNGIYVRFADGTQICWAYHDSSSFGPLFVGDDINYKYRTKGWVFPATFTIPPAVFASGDVVGAKVDVVNAQGATMTSCTLEVGQYNTENVVAGVSSLAIGRWK